MPKFALIHLISGEKMLEDVFQISLDNINQVTFFQGKIVTTGDLLAIEGFSTEIKYQTKVFCLI